MFKLNKNSSQILGLFLFGVILFVVVTMLSNKSMYRMSPTPIVVKGPNPEGSFHDLPYKLECVPGPTPEGAYYTRSLTPGGFCGDQKFAQDQMTYEISEGIGGSLI